MKVIITQRQYRLISEQVPDTRFGPERFMSVREKTKTVHSPQAWDAANKKEQQFNKDPNTQHALLGALALGTAFIPFVGPFISAGIGAADASLYYREGDKRAAALTGVFSLLPFSGRIIKLIPGIKQLGTKGMALLASKIGKGQALTKAETEIANAIKKYLPETQEELSKMAPKLKGVVKELEQYKSNFIKKFGEQEYNDALVTFLYDDAKTAKSTFINKLKNVKNPNIKIKPILAGGADHRIFASSVNPDVVFKAEVRPGEVDKWYETFRKFPNIFAKAIKKTKVKDKTGQILDAVVMEKLDTTKFAQLWDSLEKTLKKNPNESSFEYLVKHIKERPNYLAKYNKVLEQAKQELPSLSNGIDEFKKIVDNLYNIVPNPDIRRFNFGYDKSGVLKSLDL